VRDLDVEDDGEIRLLLRELVDWYVIASNLGCKGNTDR